MAKTRTERALDKLIESVDNGAEIWDVIDEIATEHRITSDTLLKAYDEDSVYDVVEW